MQVLLKLLKGLVVQKYRSGFIPFAISATLKFHWKTILRSFYSIAVAAKMSILSKLRCITVDVTGTLIAYKGELGDEFVYPAPPYKSIISSFLTRDLFPKF
jgi:hypothetical protein